MAGKPGQQGRKPRAIPEQYRDRWLADVDLRYAPARRATEALLELQDALGGAEELSPQQRMLAERATWLHLRLQSMEAEYLAGDGLDTKDYVAMTSTLVSVLHRLGMKRISRRVPSLSEYIEASKIEAPK